jgi:transcriptional regulator with XRE-family HTH domain
MKNQYNKSHRKVAFVLAYFFFGARCGRALPAAFFESLLVLGLRRTRLAGFCVLHLYNTQCNIANNRKVCHIINMTTWIQDKREELGLSQIEVATALGVSRPTYVKIETGEKQPSEQELAILSSLLRIQTAIIQKNSRPVVVPETTDMVVRDIPVENIPKFKQTLLYILSKVGSKPNVGQTALYKLLYFIDFDYYEKYESQLIGATYIKNKFGPTPISFAKIIRELEQAGELVTVSSKYFGHDQTKYIATNEPDVSQLSGQELKHIDDELARLAHLSASELSNLSHVDTPWRVAAERDVLDYEHVFYRPDETSVRDYEPL